MILWVLERLTRVGWDEGIGVVEPDDGHVGVDEDWLLLGVARIEEFEEGCELRVTEIETLMVGQKDGTDGAKTRAGILNFFDAMDRYELLICLGVGDEQRSW